MSELLPTHYPPVPEEPIGDDLEPWTWDHLQEWKDARWVEERSIAAKRLNDAELAAEVHNARLISRVRYARVENYRGEAHLHDHYEEGLHQEFTLERFATLPHYDEATS